MNVPSLVLQQLRGGLVKREFEIHQKITFFCRFEVSMVWCTDGEQKIVTMHSWGACNRAENLENGKLTRKIVFAKKYFATGFSVK